MRFPFTFMGVLALGIGIWVVVYLISHPALDVVAQQFAMGTAMACFVFAGYVLFRRVRSGPQH